MGVSLLFRESLLSEKTAKSVGAVRMASPQASNAVSGALLNFSVAHAGPRSFAEFCQIVNDQLVIKYIILCSGSDIFSFTRSSLRHHSRNMDVWLSSFNQSTSS